MCNCAQPTITEREWLAILDRIKPEDRMVIALLLQPDAGGKVELNFRDGGLAAVNVTKAARLTKQAA